jgi:hypothetical protein
VIEKRYKILCSLRGGFCGILEEMEEKPYRYLVFDLIFFIATIGLCLLISPIGLKDNHGVSYYEHYGLPLIPYAVGFFAVAFTTFLVARSLPRSNHKIINLKYVLYAVSILVFGVLATPDYINSFFNWAHILVSSILFIIEFVLAIWLAIIELKDKINVPLVLLLFVTGLLAFSSNINWTRYLFTSEVAFQIIFFFILVRTARKVKLFG